MPVISVRGRLRLLIKDEAGEWRQRAVGLDDTPENRVTAERRLAEVERALAAVRRNVAPEGGPPTVESWGETWLRGRTNRNAEGDATNLRVHVFPVLGPMRLTEVEPRHLAALVKSWTDKAPRTRRNIYSTIRGLFRGAAVEGLIRVEANPCILTHNEIGKIKDSRKFDRRAARFTREELLALVTDERIPPDRRVWYALLGLGFLRTGEAAGLTWEKVEPAEPLNRIVIDTSYDHDMTKTDVDRHVPAHPTLAAILAEWKLTGWAAMFGRVPSPSDLVCPVSPEPPRKGRMKPAGSMRDKEYAHKRIKRDLVAIEIRHRRAHDLRRTGISIALDDGADRDVLRWATHAPPTEVFDGYTSLEWETLCREVAKMRAARATSRVADPRQG
jgi:integrase